jgi:ATP-binding cassette subfamily C protein
MVKASGAEQREGARVDGAAVGAWRESVRAAKWSALAGNMAGVAAQIAFLAVLSVGGVRVASGAITVETLVAFLLYVFYLMAPIGQLVRAVTQYPIGAAAVARILEAQALPIESSASAAHAPLAAASMAPASVEFERVRFRYRDELPEVHSGVDLTVRLAA